jgi:hypothetical protein
MLVLCGIGVIGAAKAVQPRMEPRATSYWYVLGRCTARWIGYSWYVR